MYHENGSFYLLGNDRFPLFLIFFLLLWTSRRALIGKWVFKRELTLKKLIAVVEVAITGSIYY